MKKFFSINDWGEALKYFGIIANAVIFVISLGMSTTPLRTVLLIVAVCGICLSIIVGNIVTQIIELLKKIANK